MPPPPIFKGDSIVTVIDKKTIDSLKRVSLNIGVYPIVNSLVFNDDNMSSVSGENNKAKKRVFKIYLKDRISIKTINKLSQHNIILADTIVINKSKDWKEYDLLYDFSKISFNTNLSSAKISVGISRSTLWGQAYELFLEKEKEGKWKIVNTIVKERW